MRGDGLGGEGVPSDGLRADAPGLRRCRCEATIPAQVLDGFSCGAADCWRAPLVAASFEAFVVDLIRARGEEPPAPAQPPVVTSG